MPFSQLQRQTPIEHLHILKMICPFFDTAISCRVDTTISATGMPGRPSRPLTKPDLSVDRPYPAYPTVPNRAR